MLLPDIKREVGRKHSLQQHMEHWRSCHLGVREQGRKPILVCSIKKERYSAVFIPWDG